MNEKIKRNLFLFQRIIGIFICSTSLFFLAEHFYGAQTKKISNATCLSCHQNEALFKTLPETRKQLLIVHLSQIEKSVHKELSCQQCHLQISGIPHQKEIPSVDCSSCHEEEGKSYTTSIHGEAFSAGKPDVPQCKTCHGKHQILKSNHSESLTYPSQLVRVCLRCHLDQKIEEEHLLPGPEIFKTYEKSIHGKAVLKSGLQVSAVCNDCHGSHNIQPADNPESMVNKINIPSVCGKCHVNIFEEYKGSVHGKAVEGGIPEAPVCTGCHGEHSIARISDPESGVYSTNIPKTCSECHESEVLAKKYGMLAKRFSTFMSSYHGVAIKFGQMTVANCSSCHSIHEIRPSDDPLSSIHPANLSRTCGHCHPGIGEKAILGKIHIEANPESSLGKFIVRRFYYWFISFLMFVFLLYVFFDIRKHRRMKMKKGQEG